ncbi:MAG TPA: glyoxalase [Planctomycetes bacterium]|nr:glyoxalase [Planctomycetota bacterium]
MQWVKMDHVPLAMPEGGEASARGFYSGLLGFAERPKPPILAQRGGVWFQNGEIQVHLGVEKEFRPAQKAHPAFLVRGLEELVLRLTTAGVQVLRDDLLPGYDRVYLKDPFGNRIELMEKRVE